VLLAGAGRRRDQHAEVVGREDALLTVGRELRRQRRPGAGVARLQVVDQGAVAAAQFGVGAGRHEHRRIATVAVASPWSAWSAEAAAASTGFLVELAGDERQRCPHLVVEALVLRA